MMFGRCLLAAEERQQRFYGGPRADKRFWGSVSGAWTCADDVSIGVEEHSRHDDLILRVSPSFDGKR